MGERTTRLLILGAAVAIGASRYVLARVIPDYVATYFVQPVFWLALVAAVLRLPPGRPAATPRRRG